MVVGDIGDMPEENTLENGLGYGGIEAGELVQLPEGEIEEELWEQGWDMWESILNELFPLIDYVYEKMRF